jgi:hypothetical protein
MTYDILRSFKKEMQTELAEQLLHDLREVIK